MDFWKSHKLTTVIFAAISLLIFADGSAAAFDWVSLTSFRDARRMRFIDDTLYAATSGGLIAIGDPNEPGETWTNLDGLGTVDLYDIIVDGSGQKWIAGLGRLIKFDGLSSIRYPFKENDQEIRLTSLADDGNNLWVGTEDRLVLFDKTANGGQIQDSYIRFGDLNPSPEINDILLDGDSIRLATSVGLAAADRNDPALLKSPSAWRTWSSSSHPSLATNNIKRVVSYQNSIYLATDYGLFRIVYDSVSQTDSFFSLPGFDTLSLSDLKVENDSLFYYHQFGFGVIEADVGVALALTGGVPIPSTGVGNGDYRWLGSSNGDGIFHDAFGAFEEFPYTGLPGVNISDVAIDEEHRLTVGFTEKGSWRETDSGWTKFSMQRRWSTDVAIDSRGFPWMGAEGSGLWLDVGDSVINYDELNSPLWGNNDGPSLSWVYIRGLVTTNELIFAGSYRAASGYPVSFGRIRDLDQRSDWDSIGIDDGLNNDRPVTIDFQNGKLAVGTEAVGVFECTLGSDPFNRPSNSCVQLTEQNSRLVSNNVRLVEYAPDGVLWVATAFGLSRWDEVDEKFMDVPLPPQFPTDVVAMEFDSRGNLWVGGRGGAARRDVTTGQFEVFTTVDGLVANEVQSITYDNFTADIYIGTKAGISLIPSQIGQPVAEVNQVVAFPNPFVIKSDQDLLSFNFSGEGEVNLFSMAGELVRTMSTNAQWDGRNENGELVASGVYLFVIEDNSGNVGKGKILLVRE